MRFISLSFSGICLLAVIAAQFVIFALSPVEGYSGLELPRTFLGGAYPWLAAALTFVVPVGLILGLRRLPPLVPHPAVRGFVTGMAMALWSNAMTLSLPYVGGYPSLPAIAMARLVAPGPAWGRAFWWVLLAGNFFFWGSVCVAWTVSRDRPAPKRADPTGA